MKWVASGAVAFDIPGAELAHVGQTHNWPPRIF
jgi:hypothetical protein